MKVHFLGTGTSQGVPVIACDCSVCSSPDTKDQRLRCSIHLEVQDKSLVIDSGPDFRQQMLRAKVKRLDALLFTHGHKDHTAGMDDIRAYNFRQKSSIDVFADQYAQESLKLEFSYIFAKHQYPGIPQINLHTIDKEPFEASGVPITPVEVMHYKLPVLGFRVQDFTYITDANFIAEEELEKVRGTRVLVLNALRKEEHISHFTLQEAIDLAQQIGAEQTYFTHISHQMGLHQQVNAELPEGIFLAYDGLQLEL